MLYLYDKHNKFLAPCKETEFKSHGLLERQDLAKWIELNPAILGEDLMIITTDSINIGIVKEIWPISNEGGL